MNIELLEPGPEQIPVLRQLMQLYLYDLGSIDGWDIGEDGTYGNAGRIAHFWTDERRQRYQVRVDGKLSGFVLTRSGASFSGEAAHEISEFFILRKYRRQGVGRSIATRLFDEFSGPWEVAVMQTNTPARHFWRAVIGEYTGGQYEEFAAHHGPTDVVVFRFRGGRGVTQTVNWQGLDA
jgi:predicted acetyltransferase